MEDKYHYNNLIIKALDSIFFSKKIQIKDIAEQIDESAKSLYNIRNHGKIAKEATLLKLQEAFPDLKIDKIVSESSVEYSYKSNPYKKLSEALEENNEYLKEKVKRLEMENSQLKAEIYKLKK